jgi:hypothetical protein
MGPVPPGLKLAGLALAVQHLVKEARRFLPVSGTAGTFDEAFLGGVLIERVGPALDSVEGWINPGRLKFGDRGRCDPDRICGLPAGTVGWRMVLSETLSRLVVHYDALLSHLRLQRTCESREPFLHWCEARVDEIDGATLDRLEQAANVLGCF